MTAARVKRGRVDPGAEPQIQERDERACADVAWASFLSTTQLERLRFPSRRVAQRRLRALFDVGWIRSLSQGEALHRDMVHVVTVQGVEQLVERGYFPPPGPRPGRMPRLQRLPHALAIRDAFVAFRRALDPCEGLVDFRFDDDLAAEPVLRDAGVVPDAVAVVRAASGEVIVGVEVDRGTESLPILRDKFVRWRRLLRMTVGPFAHARVSLVVVCHRERRVAALTALLREEGLGEVGEVLLPEALEAAGRARYARPVFALSVRSERTGSSENPKQIQIVSDEEEAGFRIL